MAQQPHGDAATSEPRLPRADARDDPDLTDPRHPDADRDLANHDLSDHDEHFFYGPESGWLHLRRLGVALLLAGIAAIVLVSVHLGGMSSGTISDAVDVPDRLPVRVHLAEGESRMFYTERTTAGSLTNCTVTNSEGGRIGITSTMPVILQGSDVLWHGQSVVTVRHEGDYLVRCESTDVRRQVRLGRPVGTWDAVGTVALAGLGGVALLVGVGLVSAARRQARAQLR